MKLKGNADAGKPVLDKGLLESFDHERSKVYMQQNTQNIRQLAGFLTGHCNRKKPDWNEPRNQLQVQILWGTGGNSRI